MQAFPFFRTTIVEAVIPTGSNNGAFIPWQKNDLLNDAIIMGLIAYDNTMLSRTPKNALVIASLLGLSAAIVQRLPTKMVLDTFPLYSLSDTYQGGVLKEFAPFPISNTESGFVVNSGAAYTGQSACLLVNYVNNLNEYKAAMDFLKKMYSGTPYLR